MTFLFTIAGMSCKYALLKRTNKQFVAERIKKLVIPFFFGLLALVPVMTYTAEVFFNGYTDTYWKQYDNEKVPSNQNLVAHYKSCNNY